MFPSTSTIVITNTRNITSELSKQAAVLELQFNMQQTKLKWERKTISGEDLSITGEDIKIVKDSN